MNCTKCNGEIRRGERYVAIDRHVETAGRGSLLDRALGRREVVTVEDAEFVAAYHMRCAPPR